MSFFRAKWPMAQSLEIIVNKTWSVLISGAGLRKGLSPDIDLKERLFSQTQAKSVVLEGFTKLFCILAKSILERALL